MRNKTQGLLEFALIVVTIAKFWSLQNVLLSIEGISFH